MPDRAEVIEPLTPLIQYSIAADNLYLNRSSGMISRTAEY